jgi:hypothetical protein
VANDNLNDVLSNGLALLAYGLTQIEEGYWLADPIGAIVISSYIIFSWARTGAEQVRMLVGKSADPEFLEIVREMAETHDPCAALDGASLSSHAPGGAIGPPPVERGARARLSPSPAPLLPRAKPCALCTLPALPVL